MVEKLSITLPQSMVSAIKLQVKSGAYASTSEVLRAAMRDWMRKEEEYNARINSIKARVKQSLNDPKPNLSSKQMKDQLDRLFSSHQDI